MSAPRDLVIVGDAPLVAVAGAIAGAERGPQRVRVVEVALERYVDDVLTALANDDPASVDAFVALGAGSLNFERLDLWGRLRLRGFRCATLVHPRAIVDPSSVLEDNVLVGAGAIVEPGAKVGRGTIVGSGAVVGTGAEVGPWCWLASRAVVGASARVGAHSVLGAGVHLADRSAFPGPGEILVAGSYGGTFAAGVFLTDDFPDGGARIIPSRPG